MLIFAITTLAIISAQEEDQAKGIRIEAVPPAPAAENQYIAFRAFAPWMEGYLRVRFPENVNSKLGLHFLDNLQPELKRVSNVHLPEWRLDPESGELSYAIQTREGLHFGGAARVIGDAIDMTIWVRNETGVSQDISAQVCVDMSTSPTFGERDNMGTTFAWYEGKYQSLTSASCSRSKREKTGFNWVLLLNKADPDESLRAIEPDMPWWILDPMASQPVIARVTPDAAHLIAVTWRKTVRRLMTNTNIPCLHADPLHCEDLPNGAAHTWRGRLFLMKNKPELLLERTLTFITAGD